MGVGAPVLGDWIRFRNGKTSPQRSESASLPVFGSNGIIGFSEDQNVSGESIVIGRVGSYCGSTYYSPTSCWVTDNAIIAQPVEEDETRFWYYVLSSLDLNRRSHGSGQPLLNQSILKDIPFVAPPRSRRIAIAAALGVLDDKIESNRRARAYLRALGDAKFQYALDLGPRNRALEDLTLSIARGVSPKYADDDLAAPVVINQKCIRDGWVSLEPARRMQDRAVASGKRASGGDILVNSTGTGTLGRVARWHDGDVFVDSHVSVVKPDPSEVAPVILAYALLGRQDDIEALATGSTGQTELSPSRLGSLDISIPSGDPTRLAEELLAFEERADQLASEIVRLTSLRDALLPELLSGRIRVPATEMAA